MTAARTGDIGSRSRLAPEARREQLLDLGVRLLATHTLDELSIETLADEAGVSRGLLYHYFGGKRDFQRAVCRRAADELIAVTAPVPEGPPLGRLAGSLEAYLDYVLANRQGYASLVRAAAAGDPEVRAIYDEARAALTGRIFETAAADNLMDQMGLEDTPAVRLMVTGWAALVERVVLDWLDDDHGVSKSELLAMLAGALPGVLAAR